MKRINKVIPIIFFISMAITLFSCNDSHTEYYTEENRVVLVYDSLNRLLQKYQVLKGSGSIKDGYYKSYYTNGNVEYLRFYKSNKQDSIEIEYFPNGKIYKESNYRDGKLTGKWKIYDDKGTVKYYRNFYNGNLVDEGYDYYSNGVIGRYIYYDSSGNYRFSWNYDSLGFWKSEEGHGIVDVVGNKKEADLRLGDMYSCAITVVKPPNQIVDLQCHRGSNNEWINLKQSKTKRNLYYFEHECSATGKFPYRFTLILKDSFSTFYDSSNYVNLNLIVK